MKKNFYIGIAFLALGFVILVYFNNSKYNPLKHIPNEAKLSDVTGILAKCHGVGDQNRSNVQLHCWDDLINSTLQKEGLDAAFQVLASLYSTEPAFASQCHSYTHTLGWAAYRIFNDNKSVELTSKTSYCGFGFYHGFMEALLFSGGKIEEARDFCAYAGKVLANQTSDAEGACYHGIGHGTVDGSDPSAWGDPQKIIKPGLEMCEKVADTNTKKDRCASGVFNSLAIMFGDPKYKLNEPDPYIICGQQSTPYFKKACYEEMNTLVLRLNSYNLVKAARSVENINDVTYENVAIETLAGYEASFVKEKNLSNDDIISMCHSIQDNLRTSCLVGLGGGLMEFGTPGSEYIRALDLCGSGKLKYDEQKACFNRVLWLSSVFYPTQKHKMVCEMVKPDFKSYCP